jgi:hypothetical protein
MKTFVKSEAVAALHGMFKRASVTNLDHLFTQLTTKRKGAITLGEGERRARARLAAKREKNAQLPSGDRETRQRRRRSEILRGRQLITLAKKEVSGTRKGDSATIRTPRDVMAYIDATA